MVFWLSLDKTEENEGYLQVDKDLVHEFNRMTFGHSHKHFIADSPKIKRRWFRRFPLDPIFIMRILKNSAWPRIKYSLKRRLK